MVRKVLVIYLFFKMMIPRAMLAMREPWGKEKTERKKTKQKVSMIEFLALGHLPQTNNLELSTTTMKTSSEMAVRDQGV